MKAVDRILVALLALAVLSTNLAGCAPPAIRPTATLPPSPTPSLPPADKTAYAFLQSWAQEDYVTMYGHLSPSSQAEYSQEAFEQHYREVVAEATLLQVVPRILAAYQPSTQAKVSFATTFHTALVGDFEIENEMLLAYSQGRWWVEWSPALILPQLSDETFLRLTTRSPSRGNIYDRNGLGLAVQAQEVEVGVVPGQIPPAEEATVLANLSQVLGQPAADLQARYAEARPDWYVPLGQISAETGQSYYELLNNLPGVELREAWGRAYHQEIIAPHVVGVVGPIPEDEAELWRAQGYTGDPVKDRVGRTGLERWGEPYLAGQRGGRLEILSEKGQQIAVLADKPSRESSSLYTTFDRDFQKEVQTILGQQMAAIAVLEAQTGRVLALATYPLFDPNLFAGGISDWQWQNLQADQRRPLVNRATQGTYPPGSVFKVVTMAAGMEAGGLTAGSTFLCRGTWTGLGPEWPKRCWLRSGHGNIRLDKALSASCDITFYQVGLMLNGIDQDILPEYARLFGLGAPTGIEVAEDPGLVPDPAWKIQAKGEGWAPGDSVNLAIGQSELLVTPLQIASMMAAVGNGGTLYRPQTVERIAADPDNPDWTFEPVATGLLPVGDEHLAVIQDSLRKVTSASYGTAFQPFEGLSLAVAGKTGTAESGQRNPHAWFAGYAPADDPEIAIAVIVEYSGEGATHAAPLFRKVIEAYFDVEPTPTPAPTEATPTP